MCCEEDWWQGSAGAFAFEANQRDGCCWCRLIQFSRLDAVLQLPSSGVCAMCISLSGCSVQPHTTASTKIALNCDVHFTKLLLSVENKYSSMWEHWKRRTLQLNTRQVDTTCTTFEDFWGLKGYNLKYKGGQTQNAQYSEDGLDCICFVLSACTVWLRKSSQIMLHRIIRIKPN